MTTFYLKCGVNRDVSIELLSRALEHSTAREALSAALRAEVRISVCDALADIVDALYADRQSGELTGENTMAERSCADFVEAVSGILEGYGLTPESVR